MPSSNASEGLGLPTNDKDNKEDAITHRNLDDKIPPPTAVDWWGVIELGYELEDEENGRYPAPECFACHAEAPATMSDGSGSSSSSSSSLKRCAKCRVAAYCSRDCQVSDWRRHKKGTCAAFQRLRWTTTAGFCAASQEAHNDAGDLSPKRPPLPQLCPKTMMLRDHDAQAAARTELFGKLRFYACPYAVHQARELGRGFLFAQCTASLPVASLATPQDWFGRALSRPRSVVLHYLTLGEFDVEVCREDFELATIRPPLVRALESCDPDTHLVLLLRFRCGHCAVGVAPLVPDKRVCKKLGRDYFQQTGTDPLQLNLDDL